MTKFYYLYIARAGEYGHIVHIEGCWITLKVREPKLIMMTVLITKMKANQQINSVFFIKQISQSEL